MRRHGTFIVMALLLLTVPSFAHAWTLFVKVSGGSSLGTVYIQDETSGTLDPSDPSTYITALQGREQLCAADRRCNSNCRS